MKYRVQIQEDGRTWMLPTKFNDIEDARAELKLQKRLSDIIGSDARCNIIEEGDAIPSFFAGMKDEADEFIGEAFAFIERQKQYNKQINQ